VTQISEDFLECDVAVVGGGPAGLRAAEMAATEGARVILFEQKPSVGRKFLVAGKGGLNLTHDAPLLEFAAHYTIDGTSEITALTQWEELLAECSPESLRAWAGSLGIETFTATSGRVYPTGMKSAPLLRRWVERLRSLGVQFRMRHRWCGLTNAGEKLTLKFLAEGGGECLTEAKAVVLALGGASWPQTGSTGAWCDTLSQLGIHLHPLQASNCGWEYEWPLSVVEHCEGRPLKNVAVSLGDHRVRGELLITRYGLEGGALYALGAALRKQPNPLITIDFKPDSTAESLRARLGSARRNFLKEAAARWRLGETVVTLLEAVLREKPPQTADEMVNVVKSFKIRLENSRPVQEAISTAGGVCFSALNEHLMVRDCPGLFLAGEMLAWDAPTGGYLLQGCFSTGTVAGRQARLWAGLK
jgi:uncharacterized flavoprotein (TIGR03862 family)